MARCVFCGEWAGARCNRHAECALEFDRQMRRPGLTRRVLNASMRFGRTVIALIASSVAREG